MKVHRKRYISENFSGCDALPCLTFSPPFFWSPFLFIVVIGSRAYSNLTRTRDGYVMGIDEDEDAMGEEQQAKMEQLCEEFEELCRQLRYHQKE